MAAVVDAITEIDKQMLAEKIEQIAYDLGYCDTELVEYLVAEALWECEYNDRQPREAVKAAVKVMQVRPGGAWCPVCKVGHQSPAGKCPDCKGELQNT